MEIGSETWRNLIFKGAKHFGVALTNQHLNKLTSYIQILLKWNKKNNLTAITDPFEIAVKHIIDSIAPYQFVHKSNTLLDVGSGAGFPGIPLKIILPDIRSTHIDASHKKISFQKYAIRTLGLKDINAMHARVETLAEGIINANDKNTPNKKVPIPGEIFSKPKFNTQQYDVIVSRALFSLKDFILSTLPLVTQSGKLMALKGIISKESLKNINAFLHQLTINRNKNCCGYELSTHHYTLPYIDAKRTIVIVRSKIGGEID